MFEKVADILTDFTEVSRDEITPDTDLVKDLGIDSVSYFAIIFRFEDQFGIQVSDEDALKIHTVRDLVSYLEENAD